jgi:hypothetical protein
MKTPPPPGQNDSIIDATIDAMHKSGDLAPTPYIENLADHAAKLVELDIETYERHWPGSRSYDTFYAAVPAQSSVTIDATAHVEHVVNEHPDGTATHANPANEGMVRVNVSEPDVFVVDGNGNRIEGGRVMVTYRSVEMDVA